MELSDSLINLGLSFKENTNPGWLVSLYGISTLAGYLIPNPIYTYILNIYDL